MDVHEDPYAIPIASSVDRFFETYSRYLEALMNLPNAREDGLSWLAFPLGCADIISRDVKLVERLQARHIDRFMSGHEEQEWARKVIAAAASRV